MSVFIAARLAPGRAAGPHRQPGTRLAGGQAQRGRRPPGPRTRRDSAGVRVIAARAGDLVLLAWGGPPARTGRPRCCWLSDEADEDSLSLLSQWCAAGATVAPLQGYGAELELHRPPSLAGGAVLFAEDGPAGLAIGGAERPAPGGDGLRPACRPVRGPGPDRTGGGAFQAGRGSTRTCSTPRGASMSLSACSPRWAHCWAGPRVAAGAGRRGDARPSPLAGGQPSRAQGERAALLSRQGRKTCSSPTLLVGRYPERRSLVVSRRIGGQRGAISDRDTGGRPTRL